MYCAFRVSLFFVTKFGVSLWSSLGSWQLYGEYTYKGHLRTEINVEWLSAKKRSFDDCTSHQFFPLSLISGWRWCSVCDRPCLYAAGSLLSYWIQSILASYTCFWTMTNAIIRRPRSSLVLNFEGKLNSYSLHAEQIAHLIYQIFSLNVIVYDTLLVWCD